MTFRELDQMQGIVLEEPLPQEWPLQQWLASVYDLPIDALTVEDLARACRQQMHPEAVVPHCLDVLQRDPLAGELYDGELFCAVASIPTGFWAANPAESKDLLSVARLVRERPENEDLSRIAARILEREGCG